MVSFCFKYALNVFNVFGVFTQDRMSYANFKYLPKIKTGRDYSRFIPTLYEYNKIQRDQYTKRRFNFLNAIVPSLFQSSHKFKLYGCDFSLLKKQKRWDITT